MKAESGMYQDSVSLNATIGYSFSGNTYYILSGGVADFIFFHDGFSNYVFDFLNVNAGILDIPFLRDSFINSQLSIILKRPYSMVGMIPRMISVMITNMIFWVRVSV